MRKHSVVQESVTWYVCLYKCRAVSAGPGYFAALRSCNSNAVPDYVNPMNNVVNAGSALVCHKYRVKHDRVKIYEPSVKLWMVCKICRYMLEHTTAHVLLVDPTGRLPVAPSDATVSIPKSFGLGNSTPRALALQEASFPKAGLLDSLLPRKLRYQS